MRLLGAVRGATSSGGYKIRGATNPGGYKLTLYGFCVCRAHEPVRGATRFGGATSSGGLQGALRILGLAGHEPVLEEL